MKIVPKKLHFSKKVNIFVLVVMEIIDLNMDNEQIKETRFSEGIKVKKAVIETSENIVICGDFSGEIQSSATVRVADGAHVEGKIKCTNFICDGKFDGNLLATEQAEFHASCVVNGKMKVGKLSAETGAVLASMITVIPSKSKSAPKPVQPVGGPAKA